jgi:hypothetical protein
MKHLHHRKPQTREMQMKLSKPFSLALPLIKCRCGAEILLVPNVLLMSKAIEDHVEEHRRKIKSHLEAKTEAEQVRDDLLAKVFSKACEQ